jgi:gamma-butyrobetaine dioxygenase
LDEVKILSCNDSILKLEWSDGHSSRYHAIWLRDNCRCEICGDPAIGRRNLRLTSLDLDVRLVRAEFCEPGSSNSIAVTWSDGHQGLFDSAWLRGNAYHSEHREKRAYQPELWSDGFRKDPVSMDFNAVMGQDASLLDLLHSLKKRGLCFVEGAPAQPGTLELFASRIGFIQENNFGRVQDLVADRTQRSIANDVDALKPHTDEPYRASPPGILMFHCIETDETGDGASIFLDGFEAAESLRNVDPGGFETLVSHNQAFRRHFEDDVDLIAEFPVISTDEFGNICGVRINDRVAAPTCIEHDVIPVYYRAMQQLLEFVEDESRMVKKVLRPGDIAVFDNHRVLHGRTRLQFRGRRWLQWVQIERGDFHSTMRILAGRLGRERDTSPLLRGAY